MTKLAPHTRAAMGLGTELTHGRRSNEKSRSSVEKYHQKVYGLSRKEVSSMPSNKSVTTGIKHRVMAHQARERALKSKMK